MQTEILKVNGLNDEACANQIAHALTALDGVGAVTVSLAGRRVTVQIDEQRSSRAQVQRVLSEAGFPAEAQNASCCGGCCG